jgi:hypothetical protein
VPAYPEQANAFPAAKPLSPIYREFYKALFELYETKTWPKEIEDQGLINIYDLSSLNPKKSEEGKESAQQITPHKP